MIEMKVQQRLSSILTQKQKIGYLLLGSDLVIQHVSEWIVSVWQPSGTSLIGKKVTHSFPELFGMDDHLHELSNQPGESITIPKIHHESEAGPGAYYSLQIEPFAEFGASLLIIVTNVTQQMQQEWCLQQQRNELLLLSSKLDAANDLLADVLKHLVPHSVADRIIEMQELPKPGGNLRRNATILFADMRNFTQLAEQLEPEESVDVLNAYMTVIADAVRRHEGTIIQIVGDMVMATFNSPDELPNHVERAVIAALDIRTSLEKYVAAERSPQVPALGFGIGIDTGLVTAGFLGSTDRYRFSVVGDATNSAFHLCSRAAAGQIIVSHEVLMHLDERFLIRPLGVVKIKRRRMPLRIYELQQVYEPPSIPVIHDDSYELNTLPAGRRDPVLS
ncbi:MAG: adenylate/guanylate cyclase domain-containing protein [Anaerolineales bacterium]|nr:adenylate/guanylate cyclase domain-containing protein [Anaerolineales bacterium]